MRKTLLVTLAAVALLSGCETHSEGRATAILDAATPHVRPTGQALAEGDMTAAQESGARLLAILCQWRGACER